MAFTKEQLDAMLARVKERKQQPSSILGEVVKAKGKTKPRDSGMNKTEARYSIHLEALKQKGEVAWYAFEAWKLRLTDTSSWTPDFVVMLADGSIELHDCKAYWKKKGKPGIEPDALEKMKQAAETYWMLTVKAVWEVDGKWHERIF